MTLSKRLFDIALVLVLGVILAIPTLLIILWLLLTAGRPLFYLSERMRTPSIAFRLWKFRTMTVAQDDSGVSGGDKAQRITRAGRFLRRTRLDEIPQLWNVLKGDMSFVGPRPPLRTYVTRFPQIYGEVLRSRPGLTGLATLHFRRHEERLLAACQTTEETDAVYARACVPRKARFDLIYQNRRTLCFDMKIIAQTVAQVLFRR
jgi:lipopolysaccharide/colanic/teichoic acid biosynthesis glycosyltransferase